MANRSYQSVFDLPDPLADSPSPWADWANQIDPYGGRNQLATDWLQPESFTYGQPYRGGVEFDPVPAGETYQPNALTFGSSFNNQNIDAWLQEKYPQLYSFPDVSQANPGVVNSPSGAKWKAVNSWDPLVLAAVQKVAGATGVYVPANLVKSVMMRESQGVNVDDQYGAKGLMQVMPSWGTDLGLNLSDPAQNIEAGVRILAENFKLGNPETGEDSWEWAVRRYLGLGPADQYGTTNQTYWQDVNSLWHELGSTIGTSDASGGTAAPSGTTGFTSIWGGFDAPITQEFGPTPFSAQNPGEYTYGSTLNISGHPGLDVGIADGTKLFSPISGVVEIAGARPYYQDTRYGNSPQTGELFIRLPNGDALILGHMSQITVKVGDTITPGQFVGLSGYNNGAHVHVEYRRVDPNWNGNEDHHVAVDPRTMLGGAFTGTFGKESGVVNPGNVGNWESFMKAAALGQPIGQTPMTGGFGDWLRYQMGVGPAPVSNSSEPPVGWVLQNYDQTHPGGGGGVLIRD